MSFLNFKNFFVLEKKLVFLINFILILFVIFFLTFGISLKYFFYLDIIITFILSYIFFKRSKDLSKMLILTNLFILFYFLFPQISFFLTGIFGKQSYLIIILYNVFIAYLFLGLSGYKDTFLGNIRNFNFKLFFILILVSLFMGLLFVLVKEPVPSLFTSIYQGSFSWGVFFFLAGSSFAVAFSEQIIFTGFLFNVYKNLTSKTTARLQVSTLFVMFHILRFNILLSYYKINFNDYYIFYLFSYYVLLFVFMNLCIYFYSMKTKNYEGNFVYPVTIHFITDFSLFFFIVLGVGF